MSHVKSELSIPSKSQFFQDVVGGLRQMPKSLPSKYFYDQCGSQLFDRICELDEYYLTRTELAIMEQFVDEMAAAIGPRTLLVEYGSGSSTKTHLLLQRIDNLAGYVPVDISQEHLEETAEQLAAVYPDLDLYPVCADFTSTFALPPIDSRYKRKVAYFPGSTIGNFSPDQALALLSQIAELCGSGGGLLIGIDMVKDVRVLEAAYNDRQGVTEQFNLNILTHINRELDADFDLEQFRHNAFYNEAEKRVEMHLVSRRQQTVLLGDHDIIFSRGETIHTENSHKYTATQFAEMAKKAGFRVAQTWSDKDGFFNIQYLVVR